MNLLNCLKSSQKIALSQTEKRVSLNVTSTRTPFLFLLAVLAGCIPCADPNPTRIPLHVWPLSGTTTPDAMNTSYGSRINYSHWDFHNGIDLPAPVGTPIHAIKGGTVTRAGVADAIFSSRHVVIEAADLGGDTRYFVYLHLDSIESAVTVGARVTQGQLIGTVGTDGAEPTNPHLHVEVRKSPFQVDSVHPLSYLPYTDTANFTAPVADRANRLNNLMAARLLFEAPDKNEGDLLRVEVDLLHGGVVESTRIVDFNDNTTINQTNQDDCAYVNDIAVEGYQTSNMAADGRTDLQYGILARNIPDTINELRARVIDVGGNTIESAPILVPSLVALDETLDFEGAFPPSGWNTATSSSGTGTTVASDSAAAFTGSLGMVSTDLSSSEETTQRAGIERDLPTDRFEWIAEGRFNPVALNLGDEQNLYLLYFLHDTDLSVAARIRNVGGVMKAGIVTKKPDGILTGGNSNETINTGVWRKWKLHLLRIGTRETTAVLYLDDSEVERFSWDSTAFPPNKFRAGIGLTSQGATATVWTDDISITEKTPSASSICTP